MVRCSSCGDEISGFSYECNFCGRTHCSDCRLPEKHNCGGSSGSDQMTIERGPASESFTTDSGIGALVFFGIVGLVIIWGAIALGGAAVSELGKVDVPDVNVSSSSAGADNQTATSTEAHSARLNVTLVERLIHQKINDRRVNHNRPELQYDPVLASIARNHSRDMAERDYFSHTSPEGDGFEERYKAAGYECQVNVTPYISRSGGENIAQTWVNERVDTDRGVRIYTTEEELAAGVVNQWMNSSGHRKNLLRANWNNEGIGVAITETGKVYATQNFC